MLIRLIFALLFIYTVSCNNEKGDKPIVPITNNNVSDTSSLNHGVTHIEIKTFEEVNGWGYDIYVNHQKYIHQAHIPAINGLHAFKTESDANKVAELVVKKLRNNLMHPTVSIEELISLGIVIN